MTRRKNIKLKVSMNGVQVGILERVSAQGLQFHYVTSWLGRRGARPISLSMPLSLKVYKDEIALSFFDNLLPDNPQIRARIQARFHAKTDQPFDLLASAGRDCVGAVQFTPMDEDFVTDVKNIQAVPISDHKIAEYLKNYREVPLGMSEEIDDFRILIAGAQEKLAYLNHNGTWCRPRGVTPTSHIFKLPMGMLEYQKMDLSMSCENEWLCAQIAGAFGLRVASCSIEYFEDVKVLVVERFDRRLADDGSWIMRLPQEDLCQALGYSPNLKYQPEGGPGIGEIMNLLLGSRASDEDRETFFKSQVLFWLLAAIDGHAKNFSVFIMPGGQYQLTPLYDIMSAHPLLANKQLQRQKIKMAMALVGKNKHYKWNEAQCRHFISTAKQVNYDTVRAEQILHEMLAKVDDVINTVAKKLPRDFPGEIYEPIFYGMQKVAKKLQG